MKNKKIELNKVYYDQKTNQKYMIKAIKINKKTSEKFVELALAHNQDKTIVRPYNLLVSSLKLESEA